MLSWRICAHMCTTTGPTREPPLPPFFLDCSSIPKLVRATMQPGPANNPYRYPFYTHTHTRAYTHRETGHTPRGGNRGATEGEISKRRKDSGARIDPFPPIESLIPFQKPTPLLPLCDDERNNRAEKCALPSIVLFCRKVFQCFFPGGFSKDSSCRSISLGEGKEVVLAKRSQDCMIRGEDTRRQRKVLGKKGRRREGRRWKFRENRTRKFYFTIKFFFDEIPRETWKLDSYSVEWREFMRRDTWIKFNRIYFVYLFIFAPGIFNVFENPITLITTTFFVFPIAYTL